MLEQRIIELEQRIHETEQKIIALDLYVQNLPNIYNYEITSSSKILPYGEEYWHNEISEEDDLGE